MSHEAGYINSLNSSSNSILVAVRVRPLSDFEQKCGKKTVVEVLESNVLILMDPLLASSTYQSPQLRSREKSYAFDIVFPPTSTQQDVFSNTSEFLLDSIITGYNSSVFAYGPTGTGKTFTMIGDALRPGIMLSTFSSLFSKIESKSRDFEYKVTMSYLEIYNENIRDLLHPHREGLEIREDRSKGLIVAGITEVLATSQADVLRIIKRGNKRRTCEPTRANLTSSRSHAILQVVVESREKAQGIMSEILIGKISLIDLAGSERAANTKNRGIRLIEGANINKSLLALGNCINALCELNQKEGKVYIPYRDSKLTRLLKDSLGGNCRTVMITCISPSITDHEDTYNTLVYANRAKNIKTKAKRNTLNVQQHISKYTDIINQLKQEVLALRSQIVSSSQTTTQIDSILIDINKHFQEEAKIRKNIYLNQQTVDNIGFTLFAKKTQGIEIAAEKGEESKEVKGIKEDIVGLRKKVCYHEGIIEECRRRLALLEEKRETFEEYWKNAGVSETAFLQLRLAVKKHKLMMNYLDFEGKESHNKLVIEQKDMYIKLLEEQLMMRDSLISTELPNLDTHSLKQIKSYKQISTYFASHQSSSVSPKKKVKVKNSQLPFISSVINDSPSSSHSQSKTPNYRREDQKSELKYSFRYKSRNRANSLESLQSNLSAASTYTDSKQKIPTISEKYSKSPYLKSQKYSGSRLKLT